MVSILKVTSNDADEPALDLFIVYIGLMPPPKDIVSFEFLPALDSCQHSFEQFARIYEKINRLVRERRILPFEEGPFKLPSRWRIIAWPLGSVEQSPKTISKDALSQDSDSVKHTQSLG